MLGLLKKLLKWLIAGIVALGALRDGMKNPSVRAVLYVVLYLTFLIAAYTLTYDGVVVVSSAPAIGVSGLWDAKFLLLPVCLLAPYVLTRAQVFAGSPWLAIFAALALVLGLMPILALPVEPCRESLLNEWRWLEGFCETSMVGWSSLVSATSAVLHLLVLALGAKFAMKVPEKPDQAAAGKKLIWGRVWNGGTAGRRSQGRLREILGRCVDRFRGKFRATKSLS